MVISMAAKYIYHVLSSRKLEICSELDISPLLSSCCDYMDTMFDFLIFCNSLLFISNFKVLSTSVKY